MAKLRACVVFLFFAAAVGANAQTFTTLFSFDQRDGQGPQGSLIQGRDGQLYGITNSGGVHAEGTVFEITTSGKLNRLQSLDINYGIYPQGGLVQAANGDIYGTTTAGGSDGIGAIFEIAPADTITSVLSFTGGDGNYPVAGLIQANNGEFYGTALYGGTFDLGTVFGMSPTGDVKVLYSFCSEPNCADGEYPGSGLLQAANGSFYGTTYNGGASNYGTVFEITAGGTFATLYSFGMTDGAEPAVALIQANDGDLYGTTEQGGALNFGTVFRMTAEGKLKTLHSFSGPDGEYPLTSLVQGTDGDFYGTALLGGANGYGTIFKITSDGTFTTLYNLCQQAGCLDGARPDALVQATDGMFYGTTFYGGTYDNCGANGCGSVFSLSTGLGPFVETRTVSGRVGASVIILGTNLTGATAVSFNGTAATFTIVSDTEITATVPVGATTGFVTVTTPGGALTSNKKFGVVP